MKQVLIKLNDKELKRYTNWVTNYFLNIIKPFVFRDINGEVYVLHHGLNNGTLAGGYTLQSIKDYVYNPVNTNISYGTHINLICCHGGLMEDDLDISIINNTEYPCYIGADSEGALIGIIENDDEIPKMISIVKEITGIEMTVDQCKGE